MGSHPRHRHRSPAELTQRRRDARKPDSYAIGYWAPSHDLAIFYADDGQTIPSPAIVIIGRIDDGGEIIAGAGNPFQLTIDRLD
jgi:hypothetical protein